MYKFMELDEENIPKLISWLKEDLPNSVHALGFIKQSLIWQSLDNNCNVKILSPNGDFSDGTFLLIAKHKQHFLLMTLYSKTEDGWNKLQEALENFKNSIEWNNGVLFTALPDNNCSYIKKFKEKIMEICKQNLKNVALGPGLVYILPKDVASSLTPRTLPEIEIKKLQPEHADQINSVWPHRYPGSEEFIRNQIMLNDSCGCFLKDGTLVSWAVHWFYGGIGVVQTAKGYERKGYAQCAVEHLAKILHDNCWDIHVNIVKGNDVSKKFFEKLNFIKIFEAYWIDGIK